MQKKAKKTYWITGASSGIGNALAIELAKQEHHLIISSRRTDKLLKIAEQYPDQIHILDCDVTSRREMTTLFSTRMPELESLDGIFLCAGVCEYIDLPDFNLEAFGRVFEVNFQGTVNACAAASPLLNNACEPGYRPFIVGLCSMSSYVGFPRAEAYGASKAAMAYFLNALRADIRGIDVIPVYLGFVDTPMTEQNDFPMPFIIKPEQAAQGILKRLGRRPLKINIPWRLHAVLSFFSRFQKLWYSLVIPGLRRSRSAA